jgi:general secretion pathway protein F
MPEFRYVAIDAKGELIRGTLHGSDETAILVLLRRQGYTPARVQPVGRGLALAGLLHMEIGRTRGLNRPEVTNITRELAIMLESGQDMDRALRFLVETAPNRRVARTLDDIRQAVRDGKSFAAALMRHPNSFPRLYIGLVRAGEAGGTLAVTLGRLATLLERQRNLATTVQSAMIYPALLLVMTVGSVALLLTEVLPQFVPLFQQNGVALPTSTRLLIAASDFVSQEGTYILLAAVALFLVGRSMVRLSGPRLIVDRWLLHLPVIGPLTGEVIAARFSRTLGTLLQNGVPLIVALGIVREAIGNLAGVEAVDRATIAAKGGAGLAGPLAEAQIFPRRTIHLLRLGEETAQLSALALRAAEIHEEKTRVGVQRLVSLLVPLITIVMGAVVGAIVSSLLMAMLSLNDLAS